MSRFAQVSRPVRFKKRHPPVGARPGTLVIPESATPPVIRLIDYSAEHVDERQITDVEDLRACLTTDTVSWIDVHGIGDEVLLHRIGEIFGLHALALEDAVNVPQRPKSESYEQYQLFITRMTRLRPGAELEAEQVSIFIGPQYVLTLQEHPGDIFAPIRKRIRAGKGMIRRAGPDYLAYAIIDMVIDGYYPILETFGEYLQELEDEIFARPSPAVLRKIHRAKQELLAIRRAVWPQREAVSSLIREESPLISEPVRVYLRDCYDHAVQIIDVNETYRELAGSLVDMYLSSMSNRTNEVMKVLTIMASIFIPLTFIAGVYGMNFEYMPELHTRWAYPVLLLVMFGMAVGMLIYFRRKGWIGSIGDEE